MAFIKSALELAMEKSEGLTVDKEELRRKEIATAGKAACAQALAGAEESWEPVLKTQEKALSKADFSVWCLGAADTLLARIQLMDFGPASEMTRVMTFLDELGRKKASARLQKMAQLVGQFQQELKQLKEAIAQQIGPAIKQRAQQLAQQTGANPQFILEKDPTYLKVLNENLEPMRAEYSQALEQLKAEFRSGL